MGRLHRPGRAELLLWLCSAAVLCAAAGWPAMLERSYTGSGPEATAGPEPKLITARALVIREERVLELPEAAVPLAGPGEKLAAYSAYAVVAEDPAALALGLEAQRLAGAEDRRLALAEARASGSFELMAAALSGSAPEPDLGSAQPLFAGVSGLCASGADGLERLGPGEALAMDERTLRGLLGSKTEQQPGMRLITGLRWYCAALTAARLEPGTAVKLSLDGETFRARVESSGEGVLLLSGTEGMDRLAGLRQITAQIEVP